MSARVAPGSFPGMIVAGGVEDERGSRGAGSALMLMATGLLVAMPVVMAIAHRSSPLVLSLAAACALAGVIVEGRAQPLAHALARRLTSPLGMTLLLFLAWGAISALWSPSVPRSLFAWGEFVVPQAAALILAAVLPGRMGRRAGCCLAGALALAALIILGDLASGMVLRRDLGMRAAPFVLNRPALTLLVLLPVGLWLLLREKRPWLAGALACIVSAAILTSESGAAKMGLVALALAGGLTFLRRPVGLALVGAAVLLALALAPVSGELADRLIPAPIYRALARAHAQERVDIWRSFGAALRESPAIGTGFGTTAHLGTTAVAERLAPDYATLLAVGHPHSAALQIWVELGAVGAFLAAVVAALSIRALQAGSALEAAALVGLVAAALADSLVGQGAWQGWWPAAIGAALVWFRYGRLQDGRGSHGSA